jgi:phage baseplate assembly protein gpV
MANVTAKINATTAAGPKQVSVTVPATTTKLNRLQDVNVTSLADGALLQYDNNTKKWTSRNDIITDTGGDLILNGGTF